MFKIQKYVLNVNYMNKTDIWYAFSFVNLCQCRVQNDFISLDTHWSSRLRENGEKTQGKIRE